MMEIVDGTSKLDKACIGQKRAYQPNFIKVGGRGRGVVAV